MIVSHVLMLAVIFGLVVIPPPKPCRAKPSYSYAAVRTWPSMGLKEQTLELFTLKNEIFPGDSTFELSPQLYKFGLKWDAERNKTRFGRQPKPKPSARWIKVRHPGGMDHCFDGTIIDLPLDHRKTAYIMGFLSPEQNAIMTERHMPCLEKLN